MHQASKTKPATIKKVTPSFLIDFYDAHLREASLQKVAKILGTTITSLRTWIEKDPKLQMAKEKADKRREGSITTKGYIFKQLSPETQKVWENIQMWNEADDDERQHRQRTILEAQPKKIRQEIFIHALVDSAYNKSEACRVAGIARQVLDKWQLDPEFMQLVEELEWHQKNAYEGMLSRVALDGNPAALMFINKAKNADRGYNDKLTVEHTGTVTIGIDIGKLKLPLDVMVTVLDAIEGQEREIADVENMKRLNAAA